jgi:meiotic recombination protein SPO11
LFVGARFPNKSPNRANKMSSSSKRVVGAVALGKSNPKKPRLKGDVTVPVQASVNEILEHIRAEKLSIRTTPSVDPSVKIAQLPGVTEAQDLGPAEVSEKLETLVAEIVAQILRTNTFELNIPNRGASNQKYLEDVDRIVLGDKISKRLFLNTSHVRKTAITTRVIELVHEVLSKGIHITKRDLFYTDVKLFKDQGESDAVLDDVACMAGCTRTSLHVIASDKGLVVGRIQYREAGDLIDCTRMGIAGKAIPPYIDRITDIKSDAEFIILVEKEAVYLRLAEDRFYNKYPCIVITGKGQPDVATRLFLRKVRDELKIPVLALVDSDPYGLKILSVYCSGSKQMSYDSNHLTTADIKWLGVREIVRCACLRRLMHITLTQLILQLFVVRFVPRT